MKDADAAVRNPIPAFAAGGVIGTLGGLIGLGGAEFRLPLLVEGTLSPGYRSP